MLAGLKTASATLVVDMSMSNAYCNSKKKPSSVKESNIERR